MRIEGTRNLVAAARAAGARRLVAESVAFIYAPARGLGQGRGGAADDATAGQLRPGCRGALASLEQQVLGAEGIEGLVLRYGWLYGPGHLLRPRRLAGARMRKRRSPIVGQGTGIFSFIHVEDAARRPWRRSSAAPPASTTSSMTSRRRSASGCRSTPRRSARSRRAGSRSGWPRCVAGAGVVGGAIGMRGASNAKAKRELGWQPSHPSWRQGFAASLS